ncbi:MAG: RNA polymerase sigma factor [Bacteroidota bacterium]
MEKPSKVFDALLVLSVKSGDKKALGLLVERWHKKLCLQAYRYTKDWNLAQDIAQDTWDTVIRKLYTLKDVNRFSSWVLSIVTHKALDLLKKEKRQRDDLKKHYKENKTSIEQSENVKEQQIQRIMESLKELPSEQKVVLTLFYLENYNLKQISEITDVSLNTVKTRLFRAREKLKSIVKIKDDEKRNR